jgi:MOSC domain-containing protein YiiM
MNEPNAGEVVAVNVGRVHVLTDGRRSFSSAIGKRAIEGAVSLRGIGLAGDDIADRNNHGGPDRAIYAYATEDYAWWSSELGRDLRYGLFGENLATRGIDVSGALVGERWRVGETELRVTSPRIPCFKLAHAVGDSDFVKRFAAADRPGAYLAVEREGAIAAGDRIEILERPARGLSLARFVHIYFTERDRAAEFLDAPHMTDDWRAWAERELETREP